MNKFLELVEENDPALDNGSKYTISIKGPVKYKDINISGDTHAYRIYRAITDIVNPPEDNQEVSPEDQKVIDATEEAARLGHKGAEAAVRQTHLNKERKFGQILNQYKQLEK